MDNTNRIIWSIDSALAVHNDCRSHTGSTMALGKGAIINSSTKQKINMCSSTESKVIAVDDKMGDILWCNYF